MVRMLRNCLQLQQEATNAALALLIGHLACSCGHLQSLLTSMRGVLASEAALEATGSAQQDSCTVPVTDSTHSSSEDMEVDNEKGHAPPGGQASHDTLELLVRSSETSCLLHLLTHEVAVSPAVLLGSDGLEAPAVLEGLVGLLQASLTACVDEKEHIQARDASSCRAEVEDRIGRGCRCCAALVLEASLRVSQHRHFLTPLLLLPLSIPLLVPHAAAVMQAA